MNIFEKCKNVDKDKRIKSDNYTVLDDKIVEFINYYTNNMINKDYTNYEVYKISIKLQNLIEKVAIWYELRYPNYEVNKLYPGSSLDIIDVNEEMFINNPYIKYMNDTTDVVYLDWDDFYNFDAFFNTLPNDEKIYLKSKFNFSIVNIINGSMAHFHLNSDGVINSADDINHLSLDFNEKDFINISLKDAIEKIENKGILIPVDSEIRKVSDYIEKWKYIVDEFYNCVMYRIIERGGNRIGPRRAFMFAKEFNRNIDIPMAYGVDRSDPGLRSFIIEYIKAGGREDLKCYVDYHTRLSKKAKLNILTIKELLYIHGYNCFQFFTPEEEEDYQRLVSSISIYAYKRKKYEDEKEKERLEEIKRLRIERHLEKSKKRK